RAGDPQQRQHSRRRLHAVRRDDDGAREPPRRRALRGGGSPREVLRVRRLWQSKLATGGALLFASIFVAGVVAPWIIPAAAVRDVKFVARLAPPSATHWFGTDDFGRDLFSLVFLAARLDLKAALMVV